MGPPLLAAGALVGPPPTLRGTDGNIDRALRSQVFADPFLSEEDAFVHSFLKASFSPLLFPLKIFGVFLVVLIQFLLARFSKE